MIKIIISNKIFYTIITIGILIFLGIGIYAYNSGFSPSTMGHSLDEIGIPTDCLANQTLKWDGTKWNCGVDDSSKTFCSEDQVLNGNGECVENYAEDTQLTESQVDAYVANNGYIKTDTNTYCTVSTYTSRTCVFYCSTKYHLKITCPTTSADIIYDTLSD
ncbi:MAG: hypothetical protein OQK82_07640 [Candidatus Pacearchaeota archaeon]|nr:hypothetical protein [Candidatus Pacearchaeota archaeon]